MAEDSKYDQTGFQIIDRLREETAVLQAKFTSEIDRLTSLLEQPAELHRPSFTRSSSKRLSRKGGDVGKLPNRKGTASAGETFLNRYHQTPFAHFAPPSVSSSRSSQSFTEYTSTFDNDSRVDLPSQSRCQSNPRSLSRSPRQLSEPRKQLPISKHSLEQLITRPDFVDEVLSWLGIKDALKIDASNRTASTKSVMHSSHDPGRISTFSEDDFDSGSDSSDSSSNMSSDDDDGQSVDDSDDSEPYSDDVDGF